MLAVKLEEFIDTKSLDKLGELYELINKPKLLVSDTGVSYRLINHWDEKGMIRFSRASKEGDRKFSFVDFIWIKVVNELRALGLGLPIIQKIAGEVYETLPFKELMEGIAENMDSLDGLEGTEKEEFINFIKSGEYKTVEMPDLGFNYLHILISEAIATRQAVSLIIFKDGEWFAFMKNKENQYPEELIYKKEFSSHISVSITEIIFQYIIEDYLSLYFRELHIFTPQEAKLLYYIKDENYKKVFVLFKSKKHEALEIKKSETAKEEIMKVIRAREYREFILIDNENNEFRINSVEDQLPEKQEVRKKWKRKYGKQNN